MGAKVNFTIDQGATLSKLLFKKRTTTGTAVDLSANNISSVLTLRPNHTSSAPVILSVTTNANGEIYAVANASVTRAIPDGRYVFDVVLTANGTVTREVEGYVLVTPRVT